MCKVVDLGWERRKREIDDMVATVKKVDLVSFDGQYAYLTMWDNEEATIEVI